MHKGKKHIDKSEPITVLGERVTQRFYRRYRFERSVVICFDALLAIFIRPFINRHRPIPNRPAAILLSNAGYLGDLIISSALIEPLKKAYPEARLGLLTGSWNKPVTDRMDGLDHVHFLDHPMDSKRSDSLPRRIRRYLGQRRDTIPELRAAGYDIAIDLRAWAPTYIRDLWMAGVPVRIGFSRTGWGPTLTHPLPYRHSRRHELLSQSDLLRLLPIPTEAFENLMPKIGRPASSARSRLNKFLGGKKLRYAVLHPGSTNPKREWPTGHWNRLAQTLLSMDLTPVITGRGPTEMELATQIIDGLEDCINAVDALDWDMLMQLIDSAEIVFSVETAIGHLSAALGKPGVSIHGGTTDANNWRPYSSMVVTVTHTPACYPCFRQSGCATMECLVCISPDTVAEAGRRALDLRSVEKDDPTNSSRNGPKGISESSKEMSQD